MREALEASRALWRGPQGPLGATQARLSQHRTFAADCAGDTAPAVLAPHYETLLRRGRIVWGCICQANWHAYAPGGEDLPANTLYSTDAYFDARPDELMGIASAVSELKGTRPEAPDLARIAALITDEHNQAVHEPLPRSLTGGRDVFLSYTVLHRRRMPGGYLASGWLPLLICPEATRANMLLPLRYWSPRMVARWQAAAARQETAAAMAIATAPATAELADEDPRERARRRYAARPLQLTEVAAATVLRILREAGGTPAGVHLHVWTFREDGRVKYGVALDENAPDPADPVSASRGLRVVADAASLEHLAGKVVDYKAGFIEDGFVVTDPPPV